MMDRPSGTVTFLFTDVEGSTRRWDQHPEAMAAALIRHDTLLRDAIERHGGCVFKTMGDGVCAAFGSAPDALAAATEAQRALQAEQWGEVDRLGVRMALHTGLAEVRDGDYFGPPLNRVARLLAAGHGGQILLSAAVQELVRDHLPAGCELRELGEQRLKDLARSERVFQLISPDLPSEFPPLRTLDRHPHNLPVQRSPLLGRERELAAAEQLLLRGEVGLLTLTGPGGTGKTRLGLQMAADLVEHFADGVFFVALAPIGDPGLVIPTIAQTLGLRETADRPLADTLKEYLCEKQLLLLLDNFEQVLAAAPLVAELLATAPRLKVLVTSRAALHVYGEKELPVPPLALPDPERLPSLERLTQYAAVALFIQRAVDVRPDFVVTSENAPAVAEICHRLDGLPLAIELAAARVKLLPPQALLTRLERRLPLLTGGARDLPARQQTLRGAIGWSYDLLDSAEQRLFWRLAAFVGGCTLESAESVCGEDAFDGIASLVDKSLLRQEDSPAGEPRFVMLETIREFGLEQLEASGEGPEVRRRHADYFLALAEAGEPDLRRVGQAAALGRLQQEHDNLRAVLGWGVSGGGDRAVALRLAGALAWFWYLRGHWSEGRRWLEFALAVPTPSEPGEPRAKALHGAGLLAWAQADYGAARAHLEASQRAFGDLGVRWGVGFASYYLGHVALAVGDHAAALTRYEEALAGFRAVGDGWGIALALFGLGRLGLQQGDRTAAREHLERSLSLFRAQGDTWLSAQLLNSLGDAARIQGDAGRARALYEESVALFRQFGSKGGMASLLHNLGAVAHLQGDGRTAADLHRESLSLFRELGDRRGIAECLAGLGGVAAGQGAAARAARLFGAAEALLETIGARLSGANRADFERDVAVARARLDEAAFAAAWAEGRSTPPDRAITYALEADGTVQPVEEPAVSYDT